MTTAIRKTRLAPSPTGALHLGNARTFLINWAMARQNNWQIVLRIDDLDGPRIKPGADQQAVEVLSWLGMDWDEGPYYQTASIDRYETQLQRLLASDQIYPCECTRTEIQAASQSAPQEGTHEIRYPGTCRTQSMATNRNGIVNSGHGWRIKTNDQAVFFVDHLAGPQNCYPHQEVGDFLVVTKQRTPSYQFSVVVDDHVQGVTDVVRGDDLLTSTARQLLVYRALEFEPLPTYWHLPIVVGPDGRRLAKRHGNSRIAHYQKDGIRAERIVGLVAYWSGLGVRREMSADEFATWFDLQRFSPEKVVFSAADEAWPRG